MMYFVCPYFFLPDTPFSQLSCFHLGEENCRSQCALAFGCNQLYVGAGEYDANHGFWNDPIQSASPMTFGFACIEAGGQTHHSPSFAPSFCLQGWVACVYFSIKGIERMQSPNCLWRREEGEKHEHNACAQMRLHHSLRFSPHHGPCSSSPSVSSGDGEFAILDGLVGGQELLGRPCTSDIIACCW